MKALQPYSGAMTPQPLFLAPVDAVTQKIKSLFPCGAEFTFTAEALCLNIKIEKTSPSKRPDFELQISINQLPLILTLDHSVIEIMLSSLTTEGEFGAIAFDDLPPQLQLALLQTSIAPVINSLAGDTGLQIQLQTLAVTNNRNTDNGQFILQCRQSKKVGWIGLSLTDDILGLLWDRLSQISLSGIFPNLDIKQVPLQISFYLDGPYLQQGQINKLARHDIVVLPQVSPLQIHARNGTSPVFRGTLCGTDIDITHITRDQPMEHASDRHIDESMDHLKDLTMEITFEIAKQTTTLEQLKSMQPGQTFSLNKPLPSEVTLMVLGKAIATAELVQVGDQMGARINRILVSTTPSEIADNDNAA